MENILKSQQQFYAETNQQQYHYPYTNRPVIWHNSTRSANNYTTFIPNNIMLHQPSLQQLHNLVWEDSRYFPNGPSLWTPATPLPVLYQILQDTRG